MPLFPMKSKAQSCALKEPDADYRAARRVGQYRVGREAIYFPGFPGTVYLPYGAMTQVWVKTTALPLTGCCGKELPMVRLRAFYDGAFYQDFLFEKQAEADEALAAVRTANPAACGESVGV